MYPSEYRYTENHEWLKIQEGVCTLGITDYAQNELGEVVYVDLPEAGDSFDAGESFGAIDSSKTSADVYTPLAGEVVEVNSALEEEPELVNEDPHGKGWLVKIRFSSSEGLDEMLSSESYEELAKGQG
ncbi:MAG: glycine cleavage system protein GcvH [bacterium]|nr:glycine cleavage system protein GcvH [bacterium]